LLSRFLSNSMNWATARRKRCCMMHGLSKIWPCAKRRVKILTTVWMHGHK
jgi:hypothetical protein